MIELRVNSRCRLRLIFLCIAIVILDQLLRHHVDIDLRAYHQTTTTRLRPIMELPYGEQEDLSKGRSCIYNSTSVGWLLPRYNPWTCQECKAGVCQPLKRRGRCTPFRRKEVDGARTPRVHTEWNPFTTQKSHTLTMHHDGHSEYARKNAPHCSGTLSLPCFNLTRCLPQDGQPIKIFPYGKTIEALLTTVMDKLQQTGNKEMMFEKVDSEEEACLLIVGDGSFESPSALTANSHWNGGQNHYIFESSHLFGSHGDRPFNTNVNFGMAAVSPFCVDDAYVREGYDTPLPLWPKWKPPPTALNNNNSSSNEKRRLLLSFKGNIMNWEQRSWQHRWIASEYWNLDNENDEIYVDTKCSGRYHDFASDTTIPYTELISYTELLLNSTFMFCPGGGGVGSFRFAEALRAGAIPVVTSDFVPPFHPEIDWNDCLIRVSETRVVDIPNIVRNIKSGIIRRRQKQCAKLYRTVFGALDSSKDDIFLNFLSVALQIWSIRIKNALRKQLDISEKVLYSWNESDHYL